MRVLKIIPYEVIVSLILGAIVFLCVVAVYGETPAERLGPDWWQNSNKHGLDPALVAMQSDAFGWKLPKVNAQTVVAQRLPATEYVFAIVASLIVGFIAGAYGNERFGVKPLGVIPPQKQKQQHEQQ